jgi:hypothetical protein
MTRTKQRVLFAAIAVLCSTVVVSAVLLGVDIYLHGRYQRSAGFNVWGYRGTPVGKKQRNEYRVVVLGGSSAYGYGVNADEAIPAVLQRLLRQRAPSRLFTVVNLGYNNEAAYSFKPTLQDYRWLDYDLAVLYEGYNDLATDRINVQAFRHDSPVFRLTGYMPIFPIIFKEKAAAMLAGGDPAAMYRHDPGRTVFHASVARRVQAGVLDAAAEIAQSLEAQLGRVSTEPEHVVADSGTGCRAPWGPYCQSVAAAVEYVRAAHKEVVVATQPYITVGQQVRDVHMNQQAEVRAMLARRFGRDPEVGYVNLGDRLNLSDRRMSFDGMHLTAAGSEIAAAALVEPVMAMAARGSSSQS